MAKRKRSMSRHVDDVRGSDCPERYPIWCPKCGLVVHKNHAAVYGECLVCGAKVRPIRTPDKEVSRER